MTDARLVATNPVDSTLVPVSCNSRGELSTAAPLIELIPNDVEIAGDLTVTGTINGGGGVPVPGPPGPEGPEGPEGPQGPPGTDGKDGVGQLPPDPYEGAILGWLNNQLAWIGAPPVPIPEGVFGPITNASQEGIIEVEGDIPAQVGQGVTVYQCEEDGSISVAAWDNSRDWLFDTGVTTSSNLGGIDPNNPISNVFDADEETHCDTNTGSIYSEEGWMKLAFDPPISVSSVISVKFNASDADINTVTLNNESPQTVTATESGWITVNNAAGLLFSIAVSRQKNKDTAGNISLYGLKVDGRLLVMNGDYPNAPNLNLRVNSATGSMLIGVPNRNLSFSKGKYLRIPSQTVARWLVNDQFDLDAQI